ncbi:MAG: hypothetical protein PVF58_17345 [Candidatus Methanofastidiosia archaeon]|jgi:hypothetical protein
MKKLLLFIAVCVLFSIGAAHSCRIFDSDIPGWSWLYNPEIAFTISYDGTSGSYSLESIQENFIFESEPEMKHELVILCNFDFDSYSYSYSGYNHDSHSHFHYDPDLDSLHKVLTSWEITHKIVEVDANTQISEDLLGDSSFVLLDYTFLKRSLTKKEKKLFRSLKNRVIILSGFNLGFSGEFTLMNKEKQEYISTLESSSYKGWLDLGYYRIKMLKTKSTYITIEKIRNDSPKGLYHNLLVRTLFVSGIPVRQPFCSLEIDDCAMYQTENTKGDPITAGLDAYKNSVELAHSYNLTPIYGFTTSYFGYNPEIKEIFSFLKENQVLVANHGYSHCLGFADAEKLSEEILKANTDIENMWGEPPRVILVPCHSMHEESMIHALKDSPIKFVGSMGNGYDYGIHDKVFFYERTSLQLYSASVDDAPVFSGVYLYSKVLPPSVYAVTHIFNYIKKGAAYQYITDVFSFLVRMGYTPSDTETMAEEDFFWELTDFISYTKDGILTVYISEKEYLPEYTIHFMVYGDLSIKIVADMYVESEVLYQDGITYVTVVIKPEPICR